MNRLIFPNLVGFKKTVTEHFLVALREIYKVHPAYPYKDDPSKTKIRIIPTHANPTYEGRTPEFLVKVGQYEFSLQDYLHRNLFEEIKNDKGVIGGYKSLKYMRTNVTVRVRSFYAEQSEDLADELAMLAIYAAHHMFAQLGLNIVGSSVSETVESEEVNDYYDTVVNFTVDVPWQVSEVGLQDSSQADIELESGISTGQDEYRRPGVDVTIDENEN
jgi:hypothetical protein